MKRMNKERLTKRVWSAEVGGVRPRGRPRMKWMDGVKGALDAHAMSLVQGRERGRERARDRDGWRVVVNERVG